jgi:predicted RecB family nuclease
MRLETETKPCREHPTPDLWFPELPQGRRSTQTNNAIIAATKRAIAICDECFFKEECLEEGMKPDNISFGIWGGVTAGERLMLAGIDARNYPDMAQERIAYNFTINLLPHLEY